MFANFNRNQSFTSTPEIQAVIDWLLLNHLPPLPVAPRQNSREYPKLIKADLAKQIWEHCPFDDDLQPIPLFTGKNPSFLDRHGVPHLINHRQYQSKLPSGSDLRKWFANPDNGIGTLGGHSGVIWLDFDIKQFESELECSKAVKTWGELRPELKGTFCERTHSGGWRIGVKVKQKPDFTNFALFSGGNHVGEALGAGRFTVLSPTIGPSGNAYRSINRTHLAEVASLEAIGVYPSGKGKPLSEHVRQPQFNLSAMPGSIPLDMLLTDRARAIVSGNNPTGDRSEALTILICEAYGWENWAKDNGVSIRDSAEMLTHAAGTALGIDSDRIERILKTVDPASYYPAAEYKGDESSCWLKVRRLDKATFEARCPAYIKEAMAQEYHSTGNPSFKNERGVKDKSDGGGNPPVSPVSLRDRVLEILDRNHSASERKAAFIELARSTGSQLREVEQLAETIESEVDLIEGRADRTKELESLLKIGDRRLTLSHYLHPHLAQPLEQLATWMGVDTEALLTVLLPTSASLLHPETRVVVKECIDFAEPVVVYSGIVSESGNRKSPTFKAVTKPLRKLQDEEETRNELAQEKYKAALLGWKQDRSEDKGDPPEPPGPPREFFVDNTTSEALDRVKAQQQGHGILIRKDELSGLFGSYGAYKGGRGSDKEGILSGWNGDGIKVNRAGGSRLSLSHDASSIVGAIQPGKLRKIMGDLEDEQGEWGRFLWYYAPLRAFRLPDNDTRFEVGDLLEGIYRRLDKLAPIQYRFNPEAQRLYQDYHWQLEERKLAEPRQGMRAAIAKMQGYTARIASILHILWETAAGEDPAPCIPLERVKAAKALAEFYLGQVQLIHSDANAAKGEQLDIAGQIIQLSKRLGAIKARDVVRNYKSIKLSAEQVRATFVDLEAMGYGSCSGKANRLSWEYKPSQGISKTVGTVGSVSELSVPLPTVENQPHQGIQKPVGTVGDVFGTSIEDKNLPNTNSQSNDSTRSTNSTFSTNAPSSDVAIVSKVESDSTFPPQTSTNAPKNTEAIKEVAPPEPLKVGDLVTIDSPGLKRHGKQGRVARLKTEYLQGQELLLADLSIAGEKRPVEVQQSWLRRE
jgi:hypothetical protein